MKTFQAWLETLTTGELRALRDYLDSELRRRERDNARPASTPERTGRGGIYLEVKR